MNSDTDGTQPDVPEELSSITQHVRAFVRRRVGTHLSESAEDISQDSFLLALARDRDANGRSRLSTARLTRIAELRIRGQARSTGREITGLEVPAPNTGAVEREDLRQAASHGLARLRPDHHWVILLRDLLGTPWETVALMLEQDSLNGVRCLHQRARRSLGDHLQRQAGGVEGSTA